MKKLFFGFVMFLFVAPAVANYYHAHSESSYQHAHCSINNGIEEYKLSDKQE